MPSDARILVVDDEPKICTMLRAALQREGYEVQTCLAGADALEIFRTTPFDVVISDLRMPGVDGFELIRQIKALRPATPIVAVSGRTTNDTAVQALQCGADEYLTKPFDITEVRRVVESSLQHRELLAEAQEIGRGKGDRHVLPERPEGGFAQNVPVPFSASPVAATPSPAQGLVEANSRLERRVGELLAVGEMAQVIGAELRLDALLETALSSISSLTGARALTLLLLDPGQECLVVRARRGGERRGVVGERCAVGDGLAGWVAKHQVPLLIPAIEDQPVFQAMARGEGFDSGSFLSVPLLFQERLLGVVCCTDKAGGQPFDERDLRLLVSLAPYLTIAVENAQLCERVQQGAFATLVALAENLEARDSYLRGHSARVADYAARTATELGLSPGAIQTLRQAARVHDIGNLMVSDTILGRPGPLSEAEGATVREHPLRGERMVHALGFLDAAVPLVRNHHERWDGQGYPDGLKGREIDPLARILTLADAFDAMTSPRPHRQARTCDEALLEISHQAGTQFDPMLLEPFQRAVAARA
jgi:response regulator RpfG family c-di-GMP phosphodiesterase